jgi:hypothetical protein
MESLADLLLKASASHDADLIATDAEVATVIRLAVAFRLTNEGSTRAQRRWFWRRKAVTTLRARPLSITQLRKAAVAAFSRIPGGFSRRVF